MKAITRDQREKLKTFANKAFAACCTSRAGIAVTWDCEKGHTNVLAIDSELCKLLLSALMGQDEKESKRALRLMVGRFELPCTERDIFEALEAHAVGRLVI